MFYISLHIFESIITYILPAVAMTFLISQAVCFNDFSEKMKDSRSRLLLVIVLILHVISLASACHMWFGINCSAHHKIITRSQRFVFFIEVKAEPVLILGGWTIMKMSYLAREQYLYRRWHVDENRSLFLFPKVDGYQCFFRCPHVYLFCCFTLLNIHLYTKNASMFYFLT